MLKFGVEREGDLGGNKKGIEGTGLERCLVCCAADTPQVHFTSGASGEGFDGIDRRSAL